MQTINADVYFNNLLLQNNDPILMSTIGESQDTNILFMDPTLSQTAEFPNETQTFETFNPTIFNGGVDLPLGVQSTAANSTFIQNTQTILPSRNDKKSNSLKLSLSDNSHLLTSENKKGDNPVDNSKLLLTPEQINLNDNLIITLNDISGINFNLNNSLNSTADNLSLNNIIDTEIQNGYMCAICKLTFGTENDLEKHQCIEPISSELHNNESDDSMHAMELENIQEDEQITLITDYNDQVPHFIIFFII